MAAGLGTRLRPFTDFEPKALLPLMGIPMAQFALDALTRVGVRKIVANIHHHADRASRGLALLDRAGAELILSDERAELLGSAGGLRRARPHFGKDPFFLVNADVLCSVDLAALARVHLRMRERYGVTMTLTVFRSPPVLEGGHQREKYREILFDSSGIVTGWGPHAFGRPYFVGAAVLESEALSEVPPAGPSEFVPTILEPAIKAGKAAAFVTSGSWYDVGSPSLWLDAHTGVLRDLETGQLPEAWRHRIERVNQRVAQGIWIARGTPFMSVRTIDWVGPAYWSPMDDIHASPPIKLGPEGVVYGAQSEKILKTGIGFRGEWKALQPSFLPG